VTVQYGVYVARMRTRPGARTASSKESLPAPVSRAGPVAAEGIGCTSHTVHRGEEWTRRIPGTPSRSSSASRRAEKSSGTLGSATQRTARSSSHRRYIAQLMSRS
jgi:hypothetical protein